MVDSTALGFDLSVAWRSARERARVKQEYLASLMELTPSQLTDCVAGRGHLSFQKLLLLLRHDDGRIFLRYLTVELMRAADVDVNTLLAITRVEWLAWRLVDRMQKRVPVKATVRETQKKESA
jgi:hypothetical protein